MLPYLNLLYLTEIQYGPYLDLGKLMKCEAIEYMPHGNTGWH